MEIYMPSCFERVFGYMPFCNEYFDPHSAQPVADKFNSSDVYNHMSCLF